MDPTSIWDDGFTYCAFTPEHFSSRPRSFGAASIVEKGWSLVNARFLVLAMLATFGCDRMREGPPVTNGAPTVVRPGPDADAYFASEHLVATTPALIESFTVLPIGRGVEYGVGLSGPDFPYVMQRNAQYLVEFLYSTSGVTLRVTPSDNAAAAKEIQIPTQAGGSATPDVVYASQPPNLNLTMDGWNHKFTVAIRNH